MENKKKTVITFKGKVASRQSLLENAIEQDISKHTINHYPLFEFISLDPKYFVFQKNRTKENNMLFRKY